LHANQPAAPEAAKEMVDLNEPQECPKCRRLRLKFKMQQLFHEPVDEPVDESEFDGEEFGATVALLLLVALVMSLLSLKFFPFV
jgi:hypothetical protein